MRYEYHLPEDPPEMVIAERLEHIALILDEDSR